MLAESNPTKSRIKRKIKIRKKITSKIKIKSRIQCPHLTNAGSIINAMLMGL
jgi:hypothetical protein